MASARLRRSLLYVPSSSPRMLAKSLTVAADNVTYDLEDAVTETAKAGARQALRAHLEGLAASAEEPQQQTPRPEIAIRINAVSTRHALADLTAMGPRALSAVDAVVVPKVNAASDLTFVRDVLVHVRQQGAGEGDAPGQRRPPPKLIALIESARAVVDLREICAAGVGAGVGAGAGTSAPVLDGLIFAAEDFALDVGLTRTAGLGEFLYARSAVVTAARAFGLASAIDLVCTAFRGEAGLARVADESRGGRTLGFTGKQCIHPTQVAAVNAVFGRTDDDDRAALAWAVRVLAAEAKAAARGRGAFTLDGAMVDAPVVGKARRLLAQAERAGAGPLLAELRTQYEGQEPE